VLLLAPRIADSASALYARLPYYWSSLTDYITGLSIPESIRAAIADGIDAIFARISSLDFSALFRATKNVGGAVVSSVADLFTAAVMTLYMLYCKPGVLSGISGILRRVLTAKTLRRAAELYATVNDVFSRFISGRLIESLILSVLCLIGLLLSGIPYAPLLSLIVGIGNLIPIIGTFFAIIPCVLILSVIDPIKSLWFLIFVVALQQLDNNVIYPRIDGAGVGLPPFWTVCAILLGVRLFGAMGAFLAVPCAAVCGRLIDTYLTRKAA
jgi:predicted PurR-regulated permease PerM